MAWWKPKDWSWNGNKLWPTVFGGVLGGPVGALAGATIGAGVGYIKDRMSNQLGTPSTSSHGSFDMNAYIAEMMAGMEESSAAQSKLQQNYMEQMAELQRQQQLQQQEQAKAAQVEAGKTASDFPVANAADAARRQMLRRGLMSTFSRKFSAGGDKATKIGG